MIGTCHLFYETPTNIAGVLSLTDARFFYQHEDWTLQAENSQVTLFVGLFYQFHEFCLRSAYKYASIWTAPTEEAVANDDVLAVVPEQFIEKIRGTFLDALYSFLDGLVHLAFADPEQPNNGESSGSRSLENLNGSGKKVKTIDITQLDSRILITISNLSELRSVTIPKMLNDFEKTCSISIAGDGKVRLCACCIMLAYFLFSIHFLVLVDMLFFSSWTCMYRYFA